MSNETGVSRRKLAVGAAWSVPVIAVASATPAFAASCPSCADWKGTVTLAQGTNDNRVTLTSTRCLNAGTSFSVTVSPADHTGIWWVRQGDRWAYTFAGAASVTLKYSGFTAGTTLNFYCSNPIGPSNVTVTCG